MITQTQLALALDRLARTANAAVNPKTDYSYGPIPFTSDQLAAWQALTPDQRIANPRAWGILTWDTTKLGAQPTQDALTAAATNPPTVVPQSVTPRQIRLALAQQSLLTEVTALMANSATPPAVIISWNYATEFLRTDPDLATMAAALNLSGSQVDSLFILAATK